MATPKNVHLELTVEDAKRVREALDFVLSGNRIDDLALGLVAPACQRAVEAIRRELSK